MPLTQIPAIDGEEAPRAVLITDHDQLWKQLLRRFFGEFIALCFPEQAARLDLSDIEFLESEAFTDFPAGERRTVDLLARVRTLEDESEVVVLHTEIEARSKAEFDSRMYEYYSVLSLRHPEPILPIALQLSGGQIGLGMATYERRVLDVPVLTFRYLCVQLGNLCASDLVGSSSPIAPALMSLMQPGEWSLPELKLQCLSRAVANAPDEAAEFLLINCIQTYLTLAPEEEKEVDEMIEKTRQFEVREGVATYEARVFEKGLLAGREEGREEGEILSLARILRLRFGGKAPTEDLLRQCLTGVGNVDEFIDRALTANSLEEVGLPTWNQAPSLGVG